MMKKSLAAIAASVLMLTSQSALAQGPGWTANSKVQKVVVTYTGAINVRLTPELSGCTSHSGYGEQFATIYPDHPGYAAMKATVLAAYMADKPIALYLSDDTCKVNELQLGGR